MTHTAPRSSSTRLLRHSEAGQQHRHLRLGVTPVPQNVVSVVAAVAVIALLATWLFGMLPAALFVVATIALMAITPRESGFDILRFLPLLSLPFLAVASTLWSESPERTLRASLQLLITFVGAIVICRRMPATTLILLLFCGFVGVSLLILPGIPGAVANHTPLASSQLGSKNQVGFVAEMLIALSLAVAVDRRQPGLARLLTLPAAAFALPILVLSQSAGSMTSLLITLLTFPAFVIFGRIPMSGRIVVLLLSLLLVILACIYLSDLQEAWADFRVNVLKKDATLTGRTYLWDVAARLNAERPWLGRGYYAFWRPGNIDAEGLWRWGGISARMGFNFHNSFVEMQVELGWIGQGLFIMLCGAVAVIGCVRQLLRPSVPMAFFLSVVVVVYIRSYAETGLIGPWGLVTLFWVATAVYGFDLPISKTAGMLKGREVWLGQGHEPRRA